MRILLVSFEFPPQPGGIGTYSYELAQHIGQLGHTIHVMANSEAVSDKEIFAFDKKLEFQITRYKRYTNKVFKAVHRITRTLKQIRHEKIDLIFIAHPNAGIIGYVAKLLYGIPYVITGHGSEFLYKGLIWQRNIRRTYEHADYVLANSSYTAGLAEKCGFDCSNVRVIPLGADDKRYDREAFATTEIRQKLGWENRKIVLTVSRLTKRKGHRFVIEAVNQLRNEIPEILYVILGNGPEKSRLQSLVTSLELDTHVEFVGYVPDDKLPEYYAMCDVFILNSTLDEFEQAEGFGIVLIEANLMGKPVIGVKDSGMTDAIEDGKNGLLIPMNNVQATADSLSRLLNDSELAYKLGEQGYKRAKSEFTWQVVAKKSIEFLVSAASVDSPSQTLLKRIDM